MNFNTESEYSSKFASSALEIVSAHMCDPTQETAGDDALRNAGIRSILIISWEQSKIGEKKYFYLETWWHIFRDHFMLASYASTDLRAFLGDGNRSILSK